MQINKFLLMQAQQVGLMTDYHQFLIMSLDMHTIDLEPYQYSGTNITAIRIVNPEGEQIQQLENYITETETSIGEEMIEGMSFETFKILIHLRFKCYKKHPSNN